MIEVWTSHLCCDIVISRGCSTKKKMNKTDACELEIHIIDAYNLEISKIDAYNQNVHKIDAYILEMHKIDACRKVQ